MEILTSQDIPDGYSPTGEEQFTIFALFLFAMYDEENDEFILNNSNWLKSFVGPNLTKIGSSAFAYCENLIKVDFPAATVIGDFAFGGCDNLATINFPNVVTIGDAAFMRCQSLTTVDFPAAILIGERAFYGCDNLTTINFPVVTFIASYAFFALHENLTTVCFGTNFDEQTEIKFYNIVFWSNATKNANLILGENVLPLPDLDANTWQTMSGNPGTLAYTWKSINYVSIEETIKKHTVNILPNPTSNYFTLSFDLEKANNMRIVLLDLSGRELLHIYDGFTVEGNFTTTVDTEHLASGVYFLQILVDGKYTVAKVVVE